MNLKDKINSDLKIAMKSGDKLKLETIRSIRALILEFEKSGSGKEFTDEQGLSILNSAAKKRKESIEQFKAAGRIELAGKEEEELKIIMEYLPAQLSEDELMEIIKKTALEVGAISKDHFAKLMPKVIQQVKGKTDGKIVKELVERYLSTN